MLNYKFSKKANYLCACTYGPDSMALLDMVQKEGVKPIVVCINYHMFENSTDDYIQLAAYCGAHGLTFEYLDAKSLPPEEAFHEGADFKAWARALRYRFFKQIYTKHKAAGLFIAHTQDDVLELYIMQKEHNVKGADYGMSDLTELDGMIVIRPLLHYTKQDLLEYNEENRVPFSHSKQAYEDQYTRNAIRAKLNAMSEIERENLINEMKFENADKFELVSDFRESIEDGEELEIRPLIALSQDEFITAVTHFVSKGVESIVLEPEDFDKIRKFCLAPVPYASLHLDGDTYLIKQYDVLLLGRNYEEKAYEYTLEKPGKLKNEHFELDFSMGAEDRNIHDEDYPLTIRTATPTDRFMVHGYLEPVHLLFSTWKMPPRLRGLWPIFINKAGKVIYVPRYRRYFREYHSSILHMNVTDDEK